MLLLSSSTTASTATEPFGWPVSKSIGGVKIDIVSGFGRRQVPGLSLSEGHEGVDFNVPVDAAIRAARAGKVLFAGFSNAYVSRADKKEKSRLVIIRHADGMSSRYVHLNLIRVRPQQEVSKGQALGTASESDEWIQPVLHFEIHNVAGKAIDPRPLLEIPKP